MHPLARSFAAISLGWLAGALSGFSLTYLLYLLGRKLSPHEFLAPTPGTDLAVPGPMWLLALLAICALAALLSGVTVALVSKEKPTKRAFILAVLMTAGGIGVSVGERSTVPAWFSLGMVILTPCCVIAGATLYCHVRYGEAC